MNAVVHVRLDYVCIDQGECGDYALDARGEVWYATLSQQLEQLDIHKQAGQWARLYKQVRTAEERLRQAEQETSPSPAGPSEDTNRAEGAKTQECAKQDEEQTKMGEAGQSVAEGTEAGERRAQLGAIASDLLYWKGGLKVLKQARLPKWRGSFQWQIEAKVEALQTAYATLRAEWANQMDERGHAFCMRL